MSYKPDPDNDPNEIYAVIATPAELGGPTDWWTVRPTASRCGISRRTSGISLHASRPIPRIGSSVRARRRRMTNAAGARQGAVAGCVPHSFSLRILETMNSNTDACRSFDD